MSAADTAPVVSAALAEARARAGAAKARRASVTLSDEHDELHKLALQEQEDTAAARAEEKRARELRGLSLERDARGKAAGRYQVKAVDIASRLPDIDPLTLPGEGVVVLRAPPPAALRDFLREAEAKDRDLPAISSALVCQSIVYPPTDAAGAGERLQAFFEGELGAGLAVALSDDVAALGGMAAKATKRGR